MTVCGVQVCSEETMNEILQRYLPTNSHAKSYTWKYNGKFCLFNRVEVSQESAMITQSSDIHT